MNKELLEKFFANRCSASEVKQVLDWFSSHDFPTDAPDEWRATWLEYRNGQETTGTDERTLELLERVRSKTYLRHPVHRRIPHAERGLAMMPNRWPYRLRIAAILLVAFCSSWLFHRYRSSTPAKNEGVVQVVSVQAPAGMKRTKQLPDGTKVTLNANSNLSYPDKFSGSTRAVTLNGEAFFEVAHDATKPFIVITDNITTTALGTSFNICYRPDRGLAEISLATGMVRVDVADSTGGTETAQLEPGQQLAYNLTAHAFQKREVDLAELSAWKDGRLIFRKATLPKVVQQLEDWYGVTINITGAATPSERRQWTFTGTFEDQSLENVLEGLSFIKHFSYQINGKTVTLIFN